MWLIIEAPCAAMRRQIKLMKPYIVCVCVCVSVCVCACVVCGVRCPSMDEDPEAADGGHWHPGHTHTGVVRAHHTHTAHSQTEGQKFNLMSKQSWSRQLIAPHSHNKGKHL